MKNDKNFEKTSFQIKKDMYMFIMFVIEIFLR
jgi:hypothetical protein